MATINCTSTLQLAIRLLHPQKDEEILIPTITLATVNSAIYNNCKPVFLDCDKDLLLDKENFYSFVEKNTFTKNGFCFNKKTKKKF